MPGIAETLRPSYISVFLRHQGPVSMTRREELHEFLPEPKLPQHSASGKPGRSKPWQRLTSSRQHSQGVRVSQQKPWMSRNLWWHMMDILVTVFLMITRPDYVILTWYVRKEPFGHVVLEGRQPIVGVHHVGPSLVVRPRYQEPHQQN